MQEKEKAERKTAKMVKRAHHCLLCHLPSSFLFAPLDASYSRYSDVSQRSASSMS